MPRKAPSLALPFCAFAGFAPDTEAHLEALFRTPLAAEGELFRGFFVKARMFANSTMPYEVLFLLQNEAGALRAVPAFSAPPSLRAAVAATGFLLANDKGSEGLEASMSLNTGTSRHPHFAVTDQGCVSWQPSAPQCYRGKEGKYQDQLDAGAAFLAYVNADHPRSAHEKMGDRIRVLPLAEDLYAAHVQTETRKRQTGSHRRITFASSTEVRSTHMAVPR